MLSSLPYCRYLVVLAAATTLSACSRSPVPLELHVGGRTVVAADDRSQHTYSWPGIYFEARFSGPTVGVEVDDDQNTLRLFVDDELQLVLPRTGRRSLVLNGLGDREHTVRLEKVSETQGPTGRFLGFYVPDAGAALPPPTYDRLIEFIGDSNMVGYGNRSTGRICSPEQIRDTTDTSRAFPPLVARHFDADYRIIASSGFGIVRNYAGKLPGLTMPVLYDYALHDEGGPLWDNGDAADIIVIRLGTNDFSTQPDLSETWKDADALRADYRATYLRFVERLQEKHAPLHFFLLAEDDFASDVAVVRAALAAHGIDHVSVVRMPAFERIACDYHLSVHDHEKLANLLIDRISRIMP